MRKKRFFIEFEGSFIVTTVYVNGNQVGQHKGGYTGFSYDITNQLHAGDNVIAVRVDGSWQRRVPPRGGDHAAGVTSTFVQTSDSISSPKLWSPESPNLYTVYSEVYDGTLFVDNYESPLGFRSISWSATQGFSLNGQRYWLHGADAHQDHAGWYDAITDAGNERDVKMIKDCGMNFIRGSHYPHAPAFMDACDKSGICLLSEMCFWFSGTGGDSTDWKVDGYPGSAADQVPFDSSTLAQLHEMIKICRNHPSIIIWSMCNEPFFGGSEANIKALLKKMVDSTHTEDSTRLAAIGGCQRDGNLLPRYYEIGDVAGYNGDGATIYMNPSKPSIINEYGSCREDRPGTLSACWGDVQTTNGNATEYPWRSGVAIWCAFHYGTWSDYGNTGMIDHSRLPLRRWYFYRNLNLGIPYPAWPTSGTASKLSITTDRDIVTDDGKNDAQVIVQIQDTSGNWLSNTAVITLTTNNGLFPSQAPAGGNSITFTAGASDKGVREGMCAIEFRSYTAGSATLTATSGNITATKTILVKHIDDQPIIYMGTGLLNHQTLVPFKQITRQVKYVGNSLSVPHEFAGRDCSVAIYTLQGKLLNKYILKDVKSMVKISNLSTIALFAMFTTAK